VSAVPPIGALLPDDLVAPHADVQSAAGTSNAFGDLVTQGLSRVNETLQAGEVGLQRLAAGDMQNLHQVMIKLEESRLSFQLLMQVRNRLLEAYQDVMKMQV
jgi:flagellar hook-basal body complex protein FliE